LKAAVNEAKKGNDVSRYDAAVEALQEVAPDDPDAKLDMNWMEATTKQVKAETDRLEFELKGYKNNLIKESIRVSPQTSFSITIRTTDMTIFPTQHRWAKKTLAPTTLTSET
jgi:COP9 signalosome complex subunit 1